MNEVALRNAERYFEFFDRLFNRGHLVTREHALLVVERIIDDQVGLAVCLLHDRVGDPAVIAIFVDEALSVGADEQALDMTGRGEEGRGHEPFVHVDGVSANAHTHSDSASVTSFAADWEAALC